MAEPLETEVRVIGADRFVQDLSECYREIMRTGEVTKQTAQTMREARAPIMAMSRAVSGMRSVYRTQHAELLEGVRMLRQVGYVGRNVTSMWQAYSIAMMRTQDAQRSYQTASNEVVILQDELNRLQQQGITSGEEYIDVQLRLNQAKMQAKQASSDLARAQQENIVGYLGLGLQTTGLIANVADLYRHYTMMKAVHGSVTAALGIETAARYANAAASWIQAKAQAAVAAMTPYAWILIPAMIAAGAGAIAWIESQRSMQKGGIVPETGWYYLHKHEYVTPRRPQPWHPIQITNNIYGSTNPEEVARKIESRTINALRSRGVI